MLLNKLLRHGLASFRRVTWVHHLESLGLAFALMFILSSAVLNFHLDSTIHEWSNFLKHYEAASSSARQPVELFILVIFAVLFVVVEVFRWRRRPLKPDLA